MVDESMISDMFWCQLLFLLKVRFLNYLCQTFYCTGMLATKYEKNK